MYSGYEAPKTALVLLVRTIGIEGGQNKINSINLQIQRSHYGLTYWTDGLLYSTTASGDELVLDLLNDLQALLIDHILLVHLELPLVINIIRRYD